MADVIELLSNNLEDGLATDRVRQLAVPSCPPPAEPAEGVAPGKLTPQRLSDRLSAEQITTAISHYESGDSATSVARRLGVAPSALLRLLRERGVAVRKDGVTTEFAKQLAGEYEAGAAMAELEKKYGQSHSTVFRTLHRSGVALRETGRRGGRPVRVR